MLRTDVIYRVMFSPTEFTYAVADESDSQGYVNYHSAKRARLFAGDLPIVPVTEAELTALRTGE